MATVPVSHLSFVDDAMPGITRRRFGRAWGYFSARGGRITDRAEIDRLNRIGLPPAYADAWFCPDPNGHIQAVGWDDRGRKQYRYHADFRTAQEAVMKANDTPYGLAAGIWSEKGSKIHKTASQLKAGVIWANTYNKFDPTSPFGGYNESGFGREGGRHGLFPYLEVQ